MKLWATILATLLVAGCGTVGSIRTNLAKVVGVKDAGTPASMASSEKGATLPLKPGDRLTTTRFEALASQLGSDQKTVIPAQPARTVTEVTLANPTVLQTTDNQVNASTGTVDVSIRQHEIDVKSRQPILYVALGCLIAAAAFEFWLHYRTPAIACAAASVVMFAYWRLANLPDGFWAVAVALVAVAVGIYLGYERHEKEMKEAKSGAEEAKVGTALPPQPQP